MRSREEKNLEGQAGAFVGNAASQNVQMGTDTAIDSMRELLYKAGKISKVGFEQSKGNLFEYIEAAKLQTNMANCGERFDRNPVTDLAAGRGGYGGHTAPDDFRMQRNGRIVGQGQAKYNNSAWRAAQNFVDPKYTDMQRIAPTILPKRSDWWSARQIRLSRWRSIRQQLMWCPAHALLWSRQS